MRRKNKKGEGSEGKGCQEREMSAGEVMEGGRKLMGKDTGRRELEDKERNGEGRVTVDGGTVRDSQSGRLTKKENGGWE